MTTMSAATAIALSDLRQQSGLPFRKAFSNSHLADVISRHVNDFRDRAYPPDLTLMAFCSQIISPNSSCRKAVGRINRDRSKNGLSRVSASTSAYCQARSRLPVGLIRDLALETADFLEDAISFTAAIQTFEEFLPLFDVDRPEFSQRMYDAMIDLIAQQKIPHRPGRSEPKAVKRRPKGYPLLVEPRNKLQKRVGS